jgi:aspartate/glutamate racemase
MHIGLIGGIGPAATDFYYRRLISTFASRKAALELTIVHADTPTLLKKCPAIEVTTTHSAPAATRRFVSLV